MPTIVPTIAERPANAYLVTWAGMASGDSGGEIDYVGHADRSVQVVGTFGGATVTIEGSLDGENWAPLSDASGNEIAFTAMKIEAITELVMWIRPVVTGGAGTNVTVLLLLRKTMG